MDFELERTFEILRQTPRTLRSLLGGLSEEWIRVNEGPDTWSAFDIVGHLIHGEETDWITRLKIILEHGEARTFTPFDRFAMFQKSKGKRARARRWRSCWTPSRRYARRTCGRWSS